MNKRFLFASDLHGDLSSKSAVKALLHATKELKPHLKIFGGDLIDARPLRRNACKEERAEGMRDDWIAGIRFLEEWKPTHALLGNHDKRIYDLAEAETGIESEYAYQGAQELEKAFASIDCLWKPYHKKSIWKFGDLSFAHGFYAGVNACRQMANVYGSIIFGHIHAIDQYSAPSITRKVAMSSGCLCELDMKWSAHMPSSLRHSHGFIFGIINEKTGQWSAWQIEEVGGSWHIPKGIKTI
ncbi:MAG: hypothetical protein CMO74_15245 [Verrucomicrobiales bacterium]|nr:hypothetical protein [Verrucomicrobiales bacterium]|tara:strand:- start:95 stop:817 length:723 start_codon:yes stop_codon:yes gene_type:complete